MVTPDEAAPSERIRTTERSLDIVKEIQRRGGARYREIADHFDMSESTAYKHLKTLERRGYLTKEGEQYHIGLKFVNRGEYARARRPGYRLAAEKVEEISEEVSGEVDFIVTNDSKGMTLHLSYDVWNPYPDESADSANKHWRVGTYYELHCTAAGKAILSELPRDRVEEIVDSRGLPARTERTITDREELFADLERVRERGVAYSIGEYEEGLAAIAMPVSTPTGEPLGAMAVNLSLYHFQGESVQERVESVLSDAVTSIEEDLASFDYPDPFDEGTMF